MVSSSGLAGRFPSSSWSIETGPIAGNVDGTTVVLAQYKAARGADGHFVHTDNVTARTQIANFLGSLAATGTASNNGTKATPALTADLLDEVVVAAAAADGVLAAQRRPRRMG